MGNKNGKRGMKDGKDNGGEQPPAMHNNRRCVVVSGGASERVECYVL